MLIIRGVNLFHTQVEAILLDFVGLSTNYQLIVMRNGTMDDVEVKVELDKDLYRELAPAGLAFDQVINHDKLALLYHSFQKKIKDIIGLTMHVDFKVPGSIPRSEGGKLNRIVDLRKK